MGIGFTVVFLVGIWFLCRAVPYGRCLFRLVWLAFGSLIVLASWVFVSGHWRM